MSKKETDEVDHNSIYVRDECEIKGEGKETSPHWSTTVRTDCYTSNRISNWFQENGALVARATAFIYRKIIASESEGGLKVINLLFYMS